ncbi:prepilin peptidase [Mycolicibacterium moriokaense]|nr:prepilin peptidase [Mycolicibacterium moriokaense]
MGAGVAIACVLAWLVALSVYDIRQRRLPNWLTLPGALVVLAVAEVSGRGAGAVVGAMALAGVYLVVHVIAPPAMGAGDVKLAVGVGGLTGAFGLDAWTLAAIGAPLLTALVACVFVARRADTALPHGPSMCLATLVAVALVIL